MTANQASHSAQRRWLDTVGTALVSAVLAGVSETAVLTGLYYVLIADGPTGPATWCLHLAARISLFLTPLAAAVAGGILAWRRRPPMRTGPWVLAGLTAKAAALLCGTLLHIAFTGPDSIVLRPVALLLAVAAAAFPVPMMWAVIAHTIVWRHRARPRT
jgi:hypothetical protein